MELASEVIIYGLIGLFAMWSWKKIRRKTIWIVEDSRDDVFILKRHVSFNNCKLVHKPHIKGLLAELALKRPDAIIIDYKLTGTTNGDVLLAACELNEIPAVMITGYEGDIIGIDSRKVIRKGETNCFERLQMFVNQITA